MTPWSTPESGVEYVVCGLTNKRMNVGGGPEAHSFAYPTFWFEEK